LSHWKQGRVELHERFVHCAVLFVAGLARGVRRKQLAGLIGVALVAGLLFLLGRFLSRSRE